MTIRKLPAGGAWTPYPIHFYETPGAVGPLFLDEAEGLTKVAFTFQCPVSGELDMLEFLADFGPTDNATTIKVSFQDLDANGKPDGVADQYRVFTVGDMSSAWIQPGLMTSDGTDVGAKHIASRQDKLACVIEFESANTGDYAVIYSVMLNDDRLRQGVNACLAYNGAWGGGGSAVGQAALRYADTDYHYMPEFIPALAIQSTSFDATTTPDEVGLEFAFQTNVRIGGASVCLGDIVDGAEFEFILSDNENTELEAISFITHTSLVPGSGYGYHTIRFSKDIFIAANQPYTITVRPTSTNNISLLEIAFNDSVILGDYFGYLDTGGNQHMWVRVERTDGGEWTYGVSLPLISLNITGVDMDAGGATDNWEGDA